MPPTAPAKRLRNAAKTKRRKPPKRQRKPRVAAAKPALVLPPDVEPLVVSAPAHPPAQAIAPWRPAGLAAQLQRWLAGRAEAVWIRLAGLGPGPRSIGEVSRLRAENARLRAQLEALLALNEPLRTGARERVLLPFP